MPKKSTIATTSRGYPGAIPMYRKTTMYPAATSSAGIMIMKKDRFIGSPVSKQLGPRPVLRPARIRFPQNHVRNPRPRRQILQLPRDLVVEILRHVFRRRIHGLEGFEIVHELVVEPAHDLADQLFEPCEVHQEPDRIELRSFERHAHAIIVAVHVLALASVPAQGMSCRKGFFYADLKHCSPKWRYPRVADLPRSWLFRRDLPNWPRSACA